MSNTYQWRSYVVGQPEPPYQATATLNDGFAFDHLTHANGQSGTGSLSDFYSATGPVLTGVVDCLITCDPAFVTSAVTFSLNGGTIVSGVSVNPNITIEGFVGGFWVTLFSGPPGDLGGTNSTFDFTLNLIPQRTISQLRLRYSVTRPTDGLPQVFANVYDIRLIGAACALPGMPQGFTVTPSAEPGGTAKFTLQWFESPTGDLPITYYAYRVNAGTADVLLGTRVTGTDPVPYTIEDTGREVGQNYCYHVLPVNDCGVGTGTGQVCAIKEVVVLPPNNFRGLEECEGNQVSLFWEAPETPPPFNGFRIRRDGVLFATLDADVLTWVDTSPGINVQHIYSIVAYNDAGESAPASLTIIPCEWEGCVQEPEPGDWSVIP